VNGETFTNCMVSWNMRAPGPKTGIGMRVEFCLDFGVHLRFVCCNRGGDVVIRLINRLAGAA
jgi:hypothetical protein